MTSNSNAKDPLEQVQIVGRKIRKLRKSRRLTQTELASRIGIQQSDLSRMEKGEYRVSLDTLLKILAEFDLTMSQFFEAESEESFTPKHLVLVRQFNALDPEAKKEVEDYMSFKQGRRVRPVPKVPGRKGEPDDGGES